MASNRTGWMRPVGLAFAAWLVIATGLWTLRGPTGGDAIIPAVACTLAVAGLVWWIAGRFEPATGRWTALVATHAFAGLLFASLMVTMTYGLQGASAGATLRESMAGARFLGAEFVFWAWLYAVLAAGAHGLRVRDVIRGERERSAQSEARLAEARLAALQGQLNPHFLFNALHAVSALVPEDPDRAGEALARLGDLLRYAIDDGDARTVELEEELRFARAYLDMARLVMGDRLRTTWSEPDDPISVRVPPFSLQTLVENGVRHGIHPRPEGGSLEIDVAATRNRLLLTVANDGRPGPPSPTPSGRGLTNLRLRLATLYGDAATLQAGPDGDDRFVARLEIPCR